MNKERIMARMQEHLATVQEHFGDAWVGLFLQGSQNYKQIGRASCRDRVCMFV